MTILSMSIGTHAVRRGASFVSDGVFLVVLALQLLLLAIVFWQTSVPIAELLRDGGAISDLGVMLWTATAALAGLAALVHLCTGYNKHQFAVFAFAAVLSGLLAVDDMFLLHDNLLPQIGIPELAVFSVYVVAALFYVAFAWRSIFIGAPLHLAFTGAMLASGLMIDVVKDTSSGSLLALLQANEQLRIIGEDGLKFIGIGSWFTLHLRIALVTLERAVRYGG
jgi:hypothetical protein